MKRLLTLLAFVPCLLHSQNEKGISFEHGLTWAQVQEKAKASGKYIFMDCFTTWCGPCREMDKDVYADEKVGNYVNDKFIAVKAQMDTSGQDNDEVKQWYADAHTIQELYKVDGYPTFLFFSPDGRIVSKDIGYMPAEEFVKLAAAATDPSRQYYTLLSNYKQGKKDYKVMARLATTAKKLNEGGIADTIARDLKSNYLEKLGEEELCTRENLDFISMFPKLITSEDKFFHLFYRYPDKVDSLMNSKGMANRYVKYVITTEEIEDKLWHNDQPVTRAPDWKKIYATIHKKYSRIDAEKLVLDAQLNFYGRIKEWKAYAIFRNKKIKKYPPKSNGIGYGSDAWDLNVAAWYVFLYCNNKNVLAQALSWSELSIQLEQPDPTIQYLDTKANLLYKLGRAPEAIAWEENAIDVGIANARKRGATKGDFFDDYSANLDKMKKGLPTW